jgi:hypothetical protein
MVSNTTKLWRSLGFDRLSQIVLDVEALPEGMTRGSSLAAPQAGAAFFFCRVSGRRRIARGKATVSVCAEHAPTAACCGLDEAPFTRRPRHNHDAYGGHSENERERSLVVAASFNVRTLRAT